MRNWISVIQQCNKTVSNENVVTEPLSAFFIDFLIIFLAVDSSHALNVSKSWRCRHLSVPLHGPYREEKRREERAGETPS